MKPERIIVIAGAFDPLLEKYAIQIALAKKMHDWLIIALHSDEWIVRNRKKLNLSFDDRRAILLNTKGVDEVFSFNDNINGYEELNKLVNICYPGALISIFSAS